MGSSKYSIGSLVGVTFGDFMKVEMSYRPRWIFGSFLRFVLFVLFIFCVVKSVLSANAQSKPSSAADRVAVTVGEWQISCDKVTRLNLFGDCGLTQSVRSRNDGSRFLIVVFGHTTLMEPELRVVAPPGAALKSGIQILIDGNYVDGMEFEKCDVGGCFGSLLLNDETIASLRSGKQLSVAIHVSEVEGYSLPIALDNFGQAFDKFLGLMRLRDEVDSLTDALSVSLNTGAPNSASPPNSVDHQVLTELLNKYLVKGKDGQNRLAYAAWKKSGHTALKDYLARLEATIVTSLSRQEQIAFWINLYNAKTIDLVLDHYPVEKIKLIALSDHPDPFKAKIVRIQGSALSLDDITDRILRSIYRDARFAYAVSSATLGCANISAEAFNGATLDQQLETAAQDYVNHSRAFVVVDGEVRASMIYSWWKDDFGGSEQGVLRHALKFADPTLRAQLSAAVKITFDPDYYKDGLNDAS